MRFPLVTVALMATAGHTQPTLLLHAEPAAQGAATLKLIVLPTGHEPLTDARIRFLVGGEPIGRREILSAGIPPPRPGQDARVVSFGPVAPPASPVQVEAQVGAAPWQTVGTLAEGRPLDRHSSPEPGEQPVITVAACEMLGNRRFIVRVGFFNDGARFGEDLWAFLHFEPGPTGENHPMLAPLGLLASGKPTDSATWSADEVTVVTFGPHTIPADATLPIYLCAGMYDYHGDGARTRLLNADDTSRVALGRIVERDGDIAFERSAPEKEAPR